MIRLLRLALALGFAVASLVLVGSPAHACSCVQMSTQEQAEAFDQVFVGTVSDRTLDQEAGRITYNVAVEAVYKGDAEPQQPVQTAWTSAACGIERLPEGEPVIFFASSQVPDGTTSHGTVHANSCSGTGPADAATLSEVEAALGAPGEPDPPPTGGEVGSPPGQSGDSGPDGSTSDPADREADGIGADDGTVLWPVLGGLVLVGAGVAAAMTRRG